MRTFFISSSVTVRPAGYSRRSRRQDTAHPLAVVVPAITPTTSRAVPRGSHPGRRRGDRADPSPVGQRGGVARHDDHHPAPRRRTHDRARRRAGDPVAFWLPAAEKPSAPDRGPELVPILYRRIPLIDDPAVRQVIAEMLAEDGHPVTEAASSPEGLARLTAGLPGDLVRTDLGMPDMTGGEVARAIKASPRPRCRLRVPL